MTVRDLLREGTNKLNKAGIENAAYDARQLLMKAYGKTSAELLADMGRALCAGAAGGQEPQNITYCPGDCGARINYDEFITERAKHVPLQHILGTASFMGLEFRVNRDVLIPRQDTELLVETVLEREHSDCGNGAGKYCHTAEESSTSDEHATAKNDKADDFGNIDGTGNEENHCVQTSDKLRVLDLCTGSGCIAISLKRLGGFSYVAASDYSEAALEVARDNARQNDADIHFIHSDMFAAIDETYDVIVSNPPYIPSSDIAELQPEVKDYDPMAALDGGNDGLEFYRIIAEQAGARLNAGGRLYLEIGYDQAEAVSSLLRENGYSDIEVLKDLNDKDRVVIGQFM